MGTVMMAAFLEWFLWLAAFLYCLIKVFKKAEHWSIRLLATVMIFLFTALRYVVDTPSKDYAKLLPLEQFSFQS